MKLFRVIVPVGDVDAGAVFDDNRGEIDRQPWGERSFYARDPWDNPFCVVQADSEYLGGSFSRAAAGWTARGVGRTIHRLAEPRTPQRRRSPCTNSRPVPC